MVVDDVAAVIALDGNGTVGTDLFRNYMPQTPDAAMSVKETRGLHGENFFAEAAPGVEKPRIQIQARGARGTTGTATARMRLERTVRMLEARGAFVAPSGVRYLDITAVAPVESLGRDDSERHEFTVMLDVQKEKSPVTP